MDTKESGVALTEPEQSSPPSAPMERAKPRWPLLRRARVSLAILVLFANYFLAQYDKFILSYFQADVIETLGLNATQYGLLSGYNTGIVYALLALPVAFVADYTSARVWTLTIAACWWSLCVVFQGLAHTFGEVYCARLGMGIGQAAVEALSVSLISDLVAWRNVFVGESCFYVGVYVGEAISGQIATAFAATHTSWQVAMRGVGIAGVVVALLLRLSLREPLRNTSLLEHDESQSPTERQVCTEQKPPQNRIQAARHGLNTTVAYLARMRSFWLILVSAALRQLAGNVFGYYMPGYLSALYPEQTDLLSRYGIIVGAVGSATVLAGGLLTSLLWHRTKMTPIYLTALGGMVSSIFVLLMIFSRRLAQDDQAHGVVILYGTMAAAYATAETWLGCLNGLIALLLPPAYKTFGLAIWGSVQVLVYASGPEIIGLALRNEEPGTAAYDTVAQICLAVLIPVGYWACGVGMLLAIPLLRRDLNGDMIQGPLSAIRRSGFVAFGVVLVAIVIALFTMSLVYGI